MTMTEKPKSKKVQQSERILDIVNELAVFALDAREVLYHYADKLSDRSKRRVCILAKLSGEIMTLEKYIDDIGVEIVYQKAEKIFDEAKLISDRLTEEVNTIAQ